MTGPHPGSAGNGRPAHQAPTPWYPQATGSHAAPATIPQATTPAPQWGPPAGPPPWPAAAPAPSWGPPAGPPTSWPPPQAQYAQPGAPPQAAPRQAAPAGGLVCRVCGGAPALACTIRAHVGMVILMSWRSSPGPFCRTCGTAAMRQMTASTLALGWWGVVSLIVGTPFALISNLITAQRLRSLPPPGPHGQQLDPGAPLYKRPMAYVPVAVVLLLVVLSIAT